MILVDTSVLIDFFNGASNDKVALLHRVIMNKLLYGISEYTYLEILQGAKNNKEYAKLNEYLLDMYIYLLPKTIEIYEDTAQIYFGLRRQGITVRSTIDVLIARTAIEYNLSLLHNDRDFDVMAAKMPRLKIYGEKLKT